MRQISAATRAWNLWRMSGALATFALAGGCGSRAVATSEPRARERADLAMMAMQRSPDQTRVQQPWPIVITGASSTDVNKPVAHAEKLPPTPTALADGQPIVSTTADFVRVAGPTGDPDPAKRSRCFVVMLESSPANAGGTSPATPGSGRFLASDPAWEVNEGVVYLRGWRPMSKGPRTSVGGEGTTIITQTITVSTTETKERAFLIAGTSMTVSPRTQGEFPPMTIDPTVTPDVFVECALQPNGSYALRSYSLTNPGANQPPYDTIASVKPLIEMVDSIKARAFALGLTREEGCP